jgi:hypothetical protein
MPPSADERASIVQWRAAARALESQRKDELRTLTPDKALAMSDALLSLADPSRLAESRRTRSGLVEQQALFHRVRVPPERGRP